jgi:hypothetical protein
MDDLLTPCEALRTVWEEAVERLQVSEGKIVPLPTWEGATLNSSEFECHVSRVEVGSLADVLLRCVVDLSPQARPIDRSDLILLSTLQPYGKQPVAEGLDWLAEVGLATAGSTEATTQVTFFGKAVAAFMKSRETIERASRPRAAYAMLAGM